MKIRTNLVLLSATFIILIITIGFIMFQTFDRINREIGETHSVNEIIKDISELDIVTYEYLMHHETRMVQQWQLKYNSLAKLLKGIGREEMYPEYLLVLETITTNYKALGNLFIRLQDNLAKREKMIDGNGSRSEIDITFTLENRLVAQSLMRSQKITSEAFKLSDMIEQTIDQTQQRANATILFSIIGLVIFSSCISFLTIRAITRPINELTKGVEIIGKGNLEHKIIVKGKNEIDQLAGSFNKMTKDLQEITVSRDDLENEVTERKRVEEKLQSVNRQLENANQELEAFSYSVSHDLRAPLRAIIGFSNKLSKNYCQQLDDEGNRLIGVISDNSKKMGMLIDDLLSFSRLGRKALTYSDIDMEKLIRDVFEEQKSYVKNRSLKLILNGISPIRGDKAMIQQVLANLVSNAIKFSKNNKSAVIEIGVNVGKNENIYYVKDNGSGFDMRYVDKLFGVFQRLHSEKEFEGTGIGLSLVQRIIHKHGGRVWAEGEENKGATFYFTFPNKET
jgi:signal transduction histidine kinase